MLLSFGTFHMVKFGGGGGGDDIVRNIEPREQLTSRPSASACQPLGAR